MSSAFGNFCIYWYAMNMYTSNTTEGHYICVGTTRTASRDTETI